MIKAVFLCPKGEEMKIKIVYIGITPHIYFDDKEVSEVYGSNISQGVNELQKIHLDIFALSGVDIEYRKEKHYERIWRRTDLRSVLYNGQGTHQIRAVLSRETAYRQRQGYGTARRFLFSLFELISTNKTVLSAENNRDKKCVTDSCRNGGFCPVSCSTVCRNAE